MDDRRFDQLPKRLGGSRRRFLNQVAGLCGAAAVARFATDDAEAARRGYSGPPIPAPGAAQRITIVVAAGAAGACIPRARLASFPPNATLTATWYVYVGSDRSGPYYSQALTDPDGFGDAPFIGSPIAPSPNVSVTVEVSGVTVTAPVSCSS